MTSLADALATAQARKPGPKCTVARVLASLPPSEAELLVAALADPSYSNEALALACQSAAVDLGVSPIGRHRRKGCACHRVPVAA